MRRCGAAWSVLPERSVTFRYKVCGAATLRCRTKARALFLAALVGGKRVKARRTVAVTNWVYIKFWGIDPEEHRRYILLCDEWVPSDSVARQLAFKWELHNKDNQAAWISGQNYHAKLRRPYSATDVPF